VGNSNSQPAESGKVLWEVDVMKREARLGTVSPLNTYSNSEGDLSGYSDWVIQRANAIYPILGISFEGHRLQCWISCLLLKRNVVLKRRELCHVGLRREKWR
jgi:hypothetical protein